MNSQHPVEPSQYLLSFDFTGEELPQVMSLMEGDNNTVALETRLVCPMCRVQFDDKRALIEHAAEHAKVPQTERPFKCQVCYKVRSRSYLLRILVLTQISL